MDSKPPESKLKHRMALLKLAQQLSQTDIEELVFICEGVLPESTTEGIKTAISLFRELEHRAYLAPNDYSFLKECLASIGRLDLASMLPATDNHRLSDAFSQLSCNDSVEKRDANAALKRRLPEKKTLLYIVDQLRREDLKKMSFLCSSEVEGGLKLIEQLERTGLICDGNYNYLADILKDIGRHDLSLMFQSTEESKCSLTSHTSQSRCMK